MRAGWERAFNRPARIAVSSLFAPSHALIGINLVADEQQETGPERFAFVKGGLQPCSEGAEGIRAGRGKVAAGAVGQPKRLALVGQVERAKTLDKPLLSSCRGER